MNLLGSFEVLHTYILFLCSFDLIGALSVDVAEFDFIRHSWIKVALRNQIKLNHVTSHFFVDILFFLCDDFSCFIKSSSSFKSLLIEHIQDLQLSLIEEALVCGVLF